MMSPYFFEYFDEYGSLTKKSSFFALDDESAHEQFLMLTNLQPPRLRRGFTLSSRTTLLVAVKPDDMKQK